MSNYLNSEDSRDFIKKFKKWTSIHIYDICSLKKIIEDNKISNKILVESLEMLADASVFNYYSIEAIRELELHLRTIIFLIEVICRCEIRIPHDLKEKIYAQLVKFAEKHFQITEIYEQGFNNVFRAPFEDFNAQSKLTTPPDFAISNDEKFYKDGKRNYNIDFLLLYLRDTLHCIRDDENKFSEVWRRIKELLRIILGITPALVKKGISHGADLPIDNGVGLLFKQLQGVFGWKYPISSWYYEWRTLLELHFNIQNFLQERSLPSKYGESLLLECLWYCVTKSWSNPISQSESLTNMKHFVNNLLGMEPLAFPHSIWFGALDIAQELSVKTQKDSTLDICYNLALESLQKAPSSFIRFKAIEVLIKLSKRNKLFYNIVNDELENYKQSLDPVEGLRLHYMIGTIREKSSQDAGDLKGKGKIITTDVLTNFDNSISTIVNAELSCPLTSERMNFQKILSCCKNYISSETFQRIINDNKPCPFCRKIIDLNSVISLPQSEICQGIYNYLPKDDNINDVQDYDKNISNESSDDEAINISKLKFKQKFRRSDSTIRKSFKT
ncbi:39286_t:CDS:2, partial [Gigaspora margarita]